MSYLRRSATGRRATPQKQRIPGRTDQVENSAGGFVWSVDPLTRLRRFLILGAEGGSYYANQDTLVMENVQALAECDPMQAIDLIAEISNQGRAPKNDPAIFALAWYCGHKDVKVRQYALAKLPIVCRIGTHLFHFSTFVEKQRGWGRSLRRAVGEWYVSRTVDSLAYDVIKYRQRDGVSHRDMLRLSHPARRVSAGNPTQDDMSNGYETVFDWVTHGTVTEDLPHIIQGFIQAQAAKDPVETATLVRKYSLPREALNPDHLTSRRVWEALLSNETGEMPLHALVRNLPTMTRVGLLKPMSSAVQTVLDRLDDDDAIRRSRLHPLQLLVAALTYNHGQSLRGSSSWTPVGQIVDALDAAFYKSFGNVPKTGKRTMLALDVSGSMDSHRINGIPGLTPRVASSAMALVQANVGDPYTVVAFTSKRGTNMWDPSNNALMSLTISPRQRVDDVCRLTNGLPFGGTDCSLPMLGALKSGLEVDTFVIFTDNETWAGEIHPSQALQQYRDQMDRQARLVTVGMVSNGFTIADPNDPGMIDVVGFDMATPQIISDFSAGTI